MKEESMLDYLKDYSSMRNMIIFGGVMIIFGILLGDMRPYSDVFLAIGASLFISGWAAFFVFIAADRSARKFLEPYEKEHNEIIAILKETSKSQNELKKSLAESHKEIDKIMNNISDRLKNSKI